MVSKQFLRIGASISFLSSLSVHLQAASPAPNQSFVYGIRDTKSDGMNVKNIFVDVFEASSSRIAKLRGQGKNVICYFSAGSSEDWRPDYYPKSDKRNKTGKPGILDYRSAVGKDLSGWDGENWLDYRNSGIIGIMKARIQLAQSKGCDAVDPDNVDGHTNKTGFPLTSRDQKTYLQTLSNYAHSLGLKIGLKNSAETAASIQPLVDFVVVEECAKYKECSAYNSFAQNKKAIFQLEYVAKGTANNQSKCRDAANNGRVLNFANVELSWFSPCK